MPEAVPGPLEANAKDDLTALLKVRKGSRFIPVVLLVVAAAAFVIHGLSAVAPREALTARFEKACQSVWNAATKPGAPERKQKPDPTLPEQCANKDPVTVAAVVAKYRDTPSMTTAAAFNGFETQDLGGWEGVSIVIAAVVRESLDLLWTALTKYWRTALGTVLAAAGLALLPGFAGLIYRRDFWSWFGFGFAGLLAINTAATSISRLVGAQVDAGVKPAVAITGGLTPASDAETVALAASITAVVLVQLGVLLLAFRVRRHAIKPPLIASFVSPSVFNRALYWILLIFGLDSVFHVIVSKERWDRLWALLPFNDTLEWWNFILFGLPFLYAMLKITLTWTGKRRKNIVVLLDGTSNTPDQVEMGFLAQTNVFKLFRMMKSDKRGAFAPDGQLDATLCKIYDDKQITFYYTGIGNKYDNDPVIGTLSQATGLGASGIIERAYLDLIRVWRPEDRVFIFGFSRGAASARLLSRVIDERGAPRSLWTLRLLGRHWTILPSRRKSPVPINVLGCWDTVGSFGIAKTIGGINFQQLNLLHDMSVPDNVRKSIHMVALDEERQEFEPTLMEPDPIRPDRIVEVWFSGTHAGVGGGFATDRLSDVPLDFLLKIISSGYSADGKTPPGKEDWGLYLSARNGLASVPDTSSPLPESGTPGSLASAPGPEAAPGGVFTIYPDPRGQLRVWMSKLYKYRPRKLPLHAVIHESVFERMRTSEPVYAPQALFDLNDALDAKRDHICAKVAKLDETKSLDPDERTAILEYTDKLRLTRWPLYWKGIAEAHNPTPPSEVLANGLGG